MAKLYLDECVPLSLTPLLAQHGHDVTTAMLLGLRQRNDPFHFKYASTQERILITTNQSDFRLLHRFWITMQSWDVLVSSHAGILSTAIRQLDEQAFAQAITDHLSQQGTVMNTLYHKRYACTGAIACQPAGTAAAKGARTMIPEPESPEYFLASFPQDTFPRYVWSERPASLPPAAWTTETTHRDGQQGGLPLSTAQSLHIYDILCRFTGASGAIRQAEFFVYHPTDRAALAGALERYRSGAPIEPTTWIRATAKDVALIRQLGVRETGMLASASDYHTFHKFKPGGRNQAAHTYLEAVRHTVDAGIRPRLHLEDATRAPMDFMAPFIEAVQEICAAAGLRPKFRICDTMGLGLPYANVELPRSVPRLFQTLRAMGLAPEDLEFHPHNDTWLVVANCLAAVQAGCAVVNGTSLGKGERTGNAPLEGVLLHLIGMGYFADTRPDFTALNELAALYASMGEPVPPKYPLYGRDAHRTRAGVHADGLNKFWWMYAPFNVPELLGRPLEVSLTKESGLAGLTFLIRQHLGMEVPKDHPDVLAAYQWVIDQFEQGRQTSIEWEELAPRLHEVYAVR